VNRSLSEQKNARPRRPAGHLFAMISRPLTGLAELQLFCGHTIRRRYFSILNLK
jgi:hypothetical protein